MVPTAPPAVRATCSIRYSMSTYSNNRLRTGRPCLAGRVPVVHAVEPLRVGAVGAGEELDRVRVVVVVVVVNDRIAHVGRGAVVEEEACGGQDRVVRVVDVAALAILPPGSRDELHRPLRAGGRRPVDPAEVALDVVDRSQVAPIHAV